MYHALTFFFSLQVCVKKGIVDFRGLSEYTNICMNPFLKIICIYVSILNIMLNLPVDLEDRKKISRNYIFFDKHDIAWLYDRKESASVSGPW